MHSELLYLQEEYTFPKREIVFTRQIMLPSKMHRTNYKNKFQIVQIILKSIFNLSSQRQRIQNIGGGDYDRLQWVEKEVVGDGDQQRVPSNDWCSGLR